MLYEAKEYPVLTEEILIDLDDKIYERTITVEDCVLLNHYFSSITSPGLIQERLDEIGIHSMRRAAYILRGHKNMFDKDNPYPSVLGIFHGCMNVLQEHLDRGEKIQ